MFTGLWVTVIRRSSSWPCSPRRSATSFYQDANGDLAGPPPGPRTHPGSGFPDPTMLAGWLVNNQAFQVILILLISLWFFAGVATPFLSSTRVIFAAAFDRVLPDGAAQVSEKRRVPVWSLVLMLLPARRARRAVRV